MHIKIRYKRKDYIDHIDVLNQIKSLDLIRWVQNSLSYHGLMIIIGNECGIRFFLISSSRMVRSASADSPLEAPNRSSFSKVLAHIEGPEWLMKIPFFGLPEYLWIRRWSLSRRWCRRKKIRLSYIFPTQN